MTELRPGSALNTLSTLLPQGEHDRFDVATIAIALHPKRLLVGQYDPAGRFVSAA